MPENIAVATSMIPHMNLMPVYGNAFTLYLLIFKLS